MKLIFLAICLILPASIDAIKCVSCGSVEMKMGEETKVKIKSCPDPLPSPQTCDSKIKYCEKVKGKIGENKYITRGCAKATSKDGCEKSSMAGEICIQLCSKDGCNSISKIEPSIFTIIISLLLMFFVFRDMNSMKNV